MPVAGTPLCHPLISDIVPTRPKNFARSRLTTHRPRALNIALHALFGSMCRTSRMEDVTGIPARMSSSPAYLLPLLV